MVYFCASDWVSIFNSNVIVIGWVELLKINFNRSIATASDEIYDSVSHP